MILYFVVIFLNLNPHFTTYAHCLSLNTVSRQLLVFVKIVMHLKPFNVYHQAGAEIILYVNICLLFC